MAFIVGGPEYTNAVAVTNYICPKCRRVATGADFGMPDDDYIRCVPCDEPVHRHQRQQVFAPPAWQGVKYFVEQQIDDYGKPYFHCTELPG